MNLGNFTYSIEDASNEDVGAPEISGKRGHQTQLEMTGRDM
jgi:hypothetical protein